MQVFLFLEPFQQQIAVPGIHIPVEVAQVVAVDVFAMVGKLNTTTGLLGAALRQQLPFEHPFAEQR